MSSTTSNHSSASEGAEGGAKVTPKATKAGPVKEKHHDLSKKGGPNVDDELLKPLWIATKIVDCPILFCCGIFIFVIILAVLDSITFELSEEDERTWVVEDSTIVENFDMWLLAEEALTNSGDDVYTDPQTQSDSDWTMFMMFELENYDATTNNWILTPENLEIIIKYEDMIVRDKTWTNTFCYVIDVDTYECQYTSIARDVAEAFNYDYANMTTEGIRSFVWNYYRTSDSPGTIESLFNDEFTTNNHTYLYRSFYESALPITTKLTNITEYINGTNVTTTVRTSKYRNDNDDYDDQEEEYDDWVDDLWTDITVDPEAELTEGDLRIVFIEWTIYNEEFNVLLLGAMAWVLAAILAVLFWVTVHLRSLILAVSALIQIVLSFPFAYAIYRYILQIKHFDTLSTLIIFVLLGVGADDVFVFTDAWRQSLHFVTDKLDIYQRMAFAYRRASKAMLVTQTTTFFAFLATAFSNIMPISAFGLWAACIVVCNYLLVITMYPALLLIHHLYIRPWETKYCCCCCPVDPNEPDEKDEKRHAKRQKSLAKPPKQKSSETPQNKDERIELTTKSDLPPKNVTKDNNNNNDDDSDDDDDDDDGVPPPMARRQSTVAEQAIEYDCLERFFAVKWATFVGHRRVKFVVLALFAALFAIAIWRATELEEQNEEEVWFPKDHYMRMSLDLHQDFAASEESGLVYVTILFGTKSVDRDGTDFYDPEDYGKLKWDNSFDLSSYDAQLYFYQQCNALKNNSLVFQQTSVQCLFDYVIEYLDDLNMDFPYMYTSINDSTFDDDLQKEYFDEMLYNFSLTDYAFNINENRLLFVEAASERSDNKAYLRYVAISAYAKSKQDDDLDVARDAEDDWNDWVKDTFTDNSDCPNGISNPKEFSYRWVWMRTNEEFIRSAFQGIGIALPLAFVVLLLSTQNWIIAIFATLDIIGVMSCELGVMNLMGWEFGVSESVAIVIVIGFSVDYVVHLANAYLETANDERSERVSFALLTMGISVVSGAVTTLLAGIFLTFPELTFFFKMGILIITTILFSLAWSMLFFIALLSTCGPQGNTGNIPFRKLFNLCRKNDE